LKYDDDDDDDDDDNNCCLANSVNCNSFVRDFVAWLWLVNLIITK